MIPLSLGYQKGRNETANAGRCVNVFPVVQGEGAKAPLTLSERPGLKQYIRPGLGEVRAVRKVSGVVYAVVGNTFYAGTTSKGTVSGTTGKVWLEHNGNGQIMVAANDAGYVYTISTGILAAISDVDFPGAASLTFQDNYGLVVEPATGRLWNSDLNDFTVWTGTDFVTAEANPDNLLAILSTHQEILGLGEKTLEIYQNSGNADAVFQRLPGGILEIGINAPASVAKITNVALWLDDTLQVRLIEGYTPRIVSSDAIAYQIAQLGTTSDARGMAYSWNGHSIYVLSFPTANRAFAYDITASVQAGRNLWHELTSYPFTEANRWRGNCCYQDGSTVYVGDYENGWIYTLNEATHTDNEEELPRTWTTALVHDGTRRLMFHHELELEVEMGLILDDSDPQVMMRYSDDHGKTWSNELWSSIGKIGEYKNRARWHGLGCSRGRIYEFTVTDNVKLDVVGVYLRATVGAH